MQSMQIELPKEATRVWDLECPIVVNKNRIDAYITDEIREPAVFNELTFLLSTASNAETFYLHLNTPGGIIDSAFHIVDAIENSQARVVAMLTGTVASAGTIIALACDDLVVAKHTAWMSHNYSGGSYGKGHELKARQEFTDTALNTSFREIHEGFFSDKEITALIEGKDFWMGKDEIERRWENRKNYTRPVRAIAEASTKPKRGRPPLA